MQPWKASKSYFWEETPFLKLLLPLVAGIVCYEYHVLPAFSRAALMLSLISSVVAAVFFCFVKSTSSVVFILRSTLVHTSVFLFGWMLCVLNDVQNNPVWFGKRLNTAAAFRAKILDVPVKKERTWKLKVAVDKAFVGDTILPVKGDALVYVYKDDEFYLRQGDEILVPNGWAAIQNAGNPLEFDYARFARRQRIFYQQFLPIKEVQRINAAPSPELSMVDRCHNWCMLQLDHYVSDKQTLGLLQAMLLGDEMNFDAEQRQLYVETGIIHIVAISGGHVAFLFLIISGSFFWLRDAKYKWIKYLVALPFVWFYVVMAGAPSSAIRAAFMFSLLALGISAGRENNPLNQLFATAFCVLFAEPMWLFAVGFQLSFVAVLSLIIFYKRILRLWTPPNLLLKKIWAIIAASLSAELLIAPLVIFYFHLLPASFLIANVVAWLLMGALMIFGILIIVCSKVVVIAQATAFVATWVVLGFNNILEMLQSWNPASFKFLYLTGVDLFLVYGVIAGVAVFLIRQYKAALLIGLGAMCLLFISFNIGEWKALHQRFFIAYNISKGGYAGVFEGKAFLCVINDSLQQQAKEYATKELRTASRAWRETVVHDKEILTINGANLLILSTPVAIDTSIRVKSDYLLINYPVKDFNARDLKDLFRFKKLVVTGSQKRYIAQRWKDSCRKYNIDAHFTLLDGAFVLK